MKKWDFVIVVGAIALAGVLYFSGIFGNGKYHSSGGDAVIYVDGIERERFKLLENIESRVETDLGYNIVAVEDGKVFVKDANCRDRICVNSAAIYKKRQSIVCLPHKLVIEIEGEDIEESDIDSIVR